jgi:hypothetical protein
MNEDTMMPQEPTAPPMPAADEGDNDERRLADELRRLGQLLADTVKAAAGTPEAESLRRELKEGVGALRSEIDQAMESTRETTTRMSREYQASGMTRLRSDLAAALRALNRAVDSLAGTVAPREGAPPEAAVMTQSGMGMDDAGGSGTTPGSAG